MLELKKLLTKILNELRILRPLMVSQSFSNVTIPSSEYVKISSYSDLGVSTDYYFLCARIRGWQGTAVYSVITSSTGTDFYITGKAGTLTSCTVNFYFVPAVRSN